MRHFKFFFSFFTKAMPCQITRWHQLVCSGRKDWQEVIFLASVVCFPCYSVSTLVVSDILKAEVSQDRLFSMLAVHFLVEFNSNFNFYISQKSVMVIMKIQLKNKDLGWFGRCITCFDTNYCPYQQRKHSEYGSYQKGIEAQGLFFVFLVYLCLAELGLGCLTQNLLLWHMGPVVAMRGLSCSKAGGILVS